MIKCSNCGQSLQIEQKFCPNCGTPNPFFNEQREEMEKYDEAYKKTRSAVLDRTQKTAGVLIKTIIALVLIIAGIILFSMSDNTKIIESMHIKKVQSNIDKYRAEYNSLEQSEDYVLLKQWFAKNYLNEVPEFKDCLNVFNVCMYYEFAESYLMEITYPKYMENAIRDKENYCDSIIESYDCMLNYRDKEEEATEADAGHMQCINSCIDHTRILIQSTFKLDDEQMTSFDDITANERIAILMENWPYEE